MSTGKRGIFRWLARRISGASKRKLPRATPQRERIGAFVITGEHNLSADGIICAMCGTQLSKYNPTTDTLTPDFEELHKTGAVPIPNFGWFCSQECGDAYALKYQVRFQRNESGLIQYYP